MIKLSDLKKLKSFIVLKEVNFTHNMYIQNQSFSDEEALLEQLFDFGLGDPSPELKVFLESISEQLKANKEYQAYKATLSDEEEIMELEDDESRALLAERLMELYESFVVDTNQLFGIKGDQRTLLYTIDLF
jgi:ubiquitin C-terminal hydrolase